MAFVKNTLCVVFYLRTEDILLPVA